MVSSINKQLLLTAYAYLFIMEQQKAQQGSEALQLRSEPHISQNQTKKNVEFRAEPTSTPERVAMAIAGLNKCTGSAYCGTVQVTGKPEAAQAVADQIAALHRGREHRPFSVSEFDLKFQSWLDKEPEYADLIHVAKEEIFGQARKEIHVTLEGGGTPNFEALENTYHLCADRIQEIIGDICRRHEINKESIRIEQAQGSLVELKQQAVSESERSQGAAFMHEEKAKPQFKLKQFASGVDPILFPTLESTLESTLKTVSLPVDEWEVVAADKPKKRIDTTGAPYRCHVKLQKKNDATLNILTGWVADSCVEEVMAKQLEASERQRVAQLSAKFLGRVFKGKNVATSGSQLYGTIFPLVHPGVSNPQLGEALSNLYGGYFPQPTATVGTITKLNCPGVKVKAATSLWGANVFQEEFLENAKAEGIAVEQSNAVSEINAWVAEKTDDKIQQFLDGEAPKFVIVTALYLDARWMQPFKKKDDCPGTFRNLSTATGVSEPINFMTTTFPSGTKMLYHETFPAKSGGLKFSVCAVPYQGGNLEMLLVRLHPGYAKHANWESFVKELPELLRRLETETGTSRKELERPLDVYMPKFSIDVHGDITNRSLEGSTLLETPTNYGNMLTEAGIQEIDKIAIMQAVKLDVDHLGTVAAAVTALVAYPQCAMPPRPPFDEFKADVSFAAFVRSTAGSAIIEAIVVDPNEKKTVLDL